MPLNIFDHIDRVLIDEQSLQARMRELAGELEADYADVDEPLLLLGVLKGAVMFMASFSLMLQRPHMIEFMAISSYAGGTHSSGAVKVVMDLTLNIEGQHVVIIEDIIDSGRTLSYLRKQLLLRRPASLRICTLLNKPARREVDVPVDYIGFDIPDEFVVGFGLDFQELYRNIPYIAVLRPELYEGV